MALDIQMRPHKPGEQGHRQRAQGMDALPCKTKNGSRRSGGSIRRQQSSLSVLHGKQGENATKANADAPACGRHICHVRPVCFCGCFVSYDRVDGQVDSKAEELTCAGKSEPRGATAELQRVTRCVSHTCTSHTGTLPSHSRRSIVSFGELTRLGQHAAVTRLLPILCGGSLR